MIVIMRAALAGCLVAGAGVWSSLAVAEDSMMPIDRDNRFYVGGGVGATLADDDSISSIDHVPVTAAVDNTAWSYEVFAGYRFNPYLAVQGYYVDMGDITMTGAFPAVGIAATSGEAEFDSIGGQVLLSYPVDDKLLVFGMGGYGHWGIDVAAGGIDAGGNDWLAGAGVEYALFGDIWVRSQWTHYAVENIDLDNFSATIMYAF